MKRILQVVIVLTFAYQALFFDWEFSPVDYVYSCFVQNKIQYSCSFFIDSEADHL